MIDAVAISGLQATLIKQKDGSTNIDDLLGTKKESATPKNKHTDSQQITFDISAISVEKTNFTYRDDASGRQYSIKDFTLDSGRIANKVPVDINLSAAVQANQPKLNITPQLPLKSRSRKILAASMSHP